MLRSLYTTYVRAPALDRFIRRVLDAAVNGYAQYRRFHFPENYIRHWKYDMLRSHYERETVALFSAIVKPGMTVIDIGAHIGYFTRLFSEAVGQRGRVYAFEADSENFALLRRNMGGRANAHLSPLAVAERAGMIDFYHYDDKSGAHSTLDNVPLPFAKRKMTVPSVTLDAWLRERGIGHLDVIKMDIEGGEGAALHGMQETLKTTGVLVTEFAPAWIEAAGSTPRAFLETIESHGFSISAILGNGLCPISSHTRETWESALPRGKAESRHGEFVNLYCVNLRQERTAYR